MLKNISELQITIDSKVYRFSCDHDSPLGSAKAAILKFLNYITQVEDAVSAQQKIDQEKAEADKKAALEEPPKEGQDGNKQ
jgi:hypothetical protein